MAETAPLISAHNHVRKATQELQKAHTTEAAAEHLQASTDFARAARSTNDFEALRVLNLLEEQHRKLSQLIQDQNAVQQDSLKDESKAHDRISSTAAASTPVAKEVDIPSKSPLPATSMANARIGRHQRDSSPSLARDIASRRGIPQPSKSLQSPATQATAGQLSPKSSRRTSARPAAQIPPSIVDSQADLRQAHEAKKAADDEGFAKFYNNLRGGTMSKLSSVLAYAGLPLTAEETSPEASLHQRPNKRTVAATNDPDVKKIFSKAALDAIEDDHRQRGTLGHGFGPAESFYVVQKGGGTYSYADIARAHQQQLAGLAPEDEEPEFVDAKEVQGQSSPNQSRVPPPTSSTNKNGRVSFGNARTNEELDLENATLKDTLQDLAHRLAAFEAHAQDASFAALTQSVANLRPPGGGGGGEADASGMQERIRQLEKQIESQAEERQSLEGLAAKQERMLKKYQARFDEIKKSTRERERAKKEKEKAAEQSGAAGGI